MTSPPSSAAEEIRAAIIAAGGAITFDAFMDLALYGEHGFYTGPSAGRAGRRGDFLTSPEVGPLFGAVVAAMLDGEWERLGRPDEFTVVDAGAGPGTLARTVLAARPACTDALRYIAVEVSAAQRSEHPDGVESCAELPPGGFDGVVIANELLDNVPFGIAVHDGGWREAHVAAAGERFVEVLPVAIDDDVLPSRPAHGARAPLQRAAAAGVDDARGLLRHGSVMAIDYARPGTASLAALPWRDWLRTYRGHVRGDHPLTDPGSQDITADVAIDQLPPPDAVRTQAQFLQRWGIDDLVDEGRRAWEAAAAAPDLRAMRMRSRVSEAAALLEPTGLGGFTVLEWRVEPT